MNRNYPSPIILQHPSGNIKELNKPIVVLLAIFLGPIYYLYVGLNGFAKRYIVSLLYVFAFIFVGYNFSSLEKLFSVLAAIGLLVQPLYVIYLGFHSYDARCNALIKMGFKQTDSSGNILNS